MTANRTALPKHQLIVVTPENVEVGYELAGVGSRCIAVAVDHLLQLVLMLVGVFVIAVLSFGLGQLGSVFAKTPPYWFLAGSSVWVFFVFWGYFIVFEVWWAGATPGKRVAGIRVVRDGGYPVDLFAAVVRNIVRMADLLPPIYGAGVISMFVSAEHKRLGDWAAGTVVIKERRRPLPSVSLATEASPAVVAWMERIPPLPDLDSHQVAALRRFVERRRTLAIPVQAYIALRLEAKIAPGLSQKLGATAQLHVADILEALLRKHLANRHRR